jgi:hypothetical protein
MQPASLDNNNNKVYHTQHRQFVSAESATTSARRESRDAATHDFELAAHDFG